MRPGRHRRHARSRQRVQGRGAGAGHRTARGSRSTSAPAADSQLQLLHDRPGRHLLDGRGRHRRPHARRPTARLGRSAGVVAGRNEDRVCQHPEDPQLRALRRRSTCQRTSTRRISARLAAPRVGVLRPRAGLAAARTVPPDCSRASREPGDAVAAEQALPTVSCPARPIPTAIDVTLSVTGVTQDEPTGGAPDAAAGRGPDQVLLRAERDAQGDGRVYSDLLRRERRPRRNLLRHVTVGVPKGAGGRRQRAAELRLVRALTRGPPNSIR